MIYATYSLVILALILCSAFFSLAEMSFLLASPVTLRHWAEDEDNRSAAVALGMLDDANRVLTTINIGDTIVNLAAVMLGTWFFFVYYSGQGIIVGVVVLFLAILIIGEILPRMIAQRYENRVFCRVAMPLKLLVTLLRPLTFIFGSGHVIMERAGREDDEEEYVEDELLNSRLPVYHDSIDNIIGILHLKDVFNTMLDGELREYVSLLQPVEFVFIQSKASSLLMSLQKNQSHMAVVVDEYGGTAGIVTLEDIMEELVGEIWDEHDEVAEQPIRAIEPTVFEADANMDIDDFFEYFGLDFDDYEDDIDASSLGGWVVDLLDHLASPGEVATFPPFTITVLEVEKRHIEKVRVVVAEETASEEE